MLYFKIYEFLIFRNFFGFFLNFSNFFMNFYGFSGIKMNFSNLKLIFQIIYSAQVTWRNLERLIDRDG